MSKFMFQVRSHWKKKKTSELLSPILWSSPASYLRKESLHGEIFPVMRKEKVWLWKHSKTKVSEVDYLRRNSKVWGFKEHEKMEEYFRIALLRLRLWTWSEITQNVCRESSWGDILVQKTWKDIGLTISEGKKTHYTINIGVFIPL